MTQHQRPYGINRRHAVSTAAAVGIGVPFLAACGGDDEPTSASDTSDDSSADDSPSSSEPEASGPLATTGDVPEGGGTVLGDQKVVVTQPTSGDFKAFSAMCTHRGCVVAEVTDTINCNCHGSMFSIEDGSVVQGPATEGLAEQQITVDGDEIILA